MNQYCLVCSNRILTSPNAIQIFTEYTPVGMRLLSEVLSEILEKTLQENSLHANVICKKCHKACEEYDSLKYRLQTLKNDLLSKFKDTLPIFNHNYDTLVLSSPDNSPVKTEGNTGMKVGKGVVVLPASKLQPLPPNYVINVGKLAAGLGTNMTMAKIVPSPTLNLKVTVGSSVLTQTIKTSSASTQKPTIQILPRSQGDTVIHTSTNSVDSSKQNEYAVVTKNFAETKLEPIEEINEEHPMEIDEDCTTLLRVTASNIKDPLNDEESETEDTNQQKTEFFDMPALDSDSQREELVLRELQVLDDENDENDGDSETIVMTDSDGSILRMVTGQKLVYDEGEISLVMPDDDSGQGNQDNDGGDDSNDESQIELQVSGDEETANAIIAAAQEQGGAFIKVESGEMFRVKSVKSQPKEASFSEVTSDDGDSIQSIVSRDRNVFTCLICEKSEIDRKRVSGDADAIMQHVRDAHNARLYICRVCWQLFRKRRDYYKHSEEHVDRKVVSLDKSKLHECNVCNKKYNSRTLLTEHMNLHSGTRPYTCEECSKTFASKYTYQAHLKTHLDRPRPFKCSKCSKSFLTQQNLNQHEKTHSGIKEFICKVCGKAFGSQHNLEVHGVVHSGCRPFVCGMCGKAFARRAEVKDHMRTHTGERPFACNICGATFAQRSNLHSHRRATHMDDKRHACTQCPKKFKRRRLLEYHIKASHTGERPLVCEVCNATFVYPEHYKKHIRIHSGERPYVCEVCGKSFNSRDNRNTHRFVHSDKKPYECLVCGIGFMRKQVLYSHMNSSGHLAESIVVNQPRVQKAVDNVVTTQTTSGHGSKLKTIYESTEELELSLAEKSVVTSSSNSGPKLFITDDKKIILQDGKSTINLVQDNDDPTLLTLHNVDKSEAAALLQGVTVEQLGEQTQLVTSEDGSVVRLVQIQLDDGNTGWVAINHHT